MDVNHSKPKKDGTRKDTVKWTPELHEYIISELEKGRTISAICAEPNMPDRSNIYRWMRDEDHPMARDYMPAREMGLLAIGDELIEISDEATEDNYNAIKVRLDTRKWVLSKLMPRQFGDRQDINVSGTIEHKKKLPSDRDLARILTKLAFETKTPLLLEAETIDGDDTDGENKQDRTQIEDASEES